MWNNIEDMILYEDRDIVCHVTAAGMCRTECSENRCRIWKAL